MRQVGIIAAGCLHALDHHVPRLADDHRRAKQLAAGFRQAAGLAVPEPDTNIVIADLDDRTPDVHALVDALEAQGVRTLDFGPRRIRAVTHLDVDDAGIERAIAAMIEVRGTVRAAG
jgi:threonine aldolase